MCVWRSTSPGVTYLPGRVDHLERGLGRDVGVDRGDPAARDRDVQAALAASARVDDLASSDRADRTASLVPSPAVACDSRTPRPLRGSSPARRGVRARSGRSRRARRPSSRASRTLATRFSGDSQSGGDGRSTSAIGQSPSCSPVGLEVEPQALRRSARSRPPRPRGTPAPAGRDRRRRATRSRRPERRPAAPSHSP